MSTEWEPEWTRSWAKAAPVSCKHPLNQLVDAFIRYYPEQKLTFLEEYKQRSKKYINK